MIACLAHNLLRWTTVLGLPGHAARWTLHLPARWPWQTDFIRALTRIRALRTPA